MAQQGPQSAERLSSRQKAALLMLSLDVETATKLMRQFSQDEIEALTVEITNVKGVSSNVIDMVLGEFHQLITAQEYVIQGGLDYAQKLLESSLGFAKAADVLDKVKALTHVKGFGALKKADGGQLASFLQKEHPQTIALILSNLTPDQTAQVLTEFPEELRNNVSYRMATLGKVSPALLKEVEDVVEEIAQNEISQSLSLMGGAKAVATVLNKCNNATAKTILETIEQQDSQLAMEIKRLMFMFDDLMFVDDRGIQRILREVDKKELALSLKVCDDKLKDKILQNMSERARDLLKEELQYMGPVRLKEVEAAQTRIVDIVKQLEDQGEIVIAGRGGTEEVFV
ncbi:MAG TPA: flagellar motor switch protein FliG [Bacteroidota bacterium]|nr:flagellar motor switch protein FliG [Bacteroidota bacterium]